MDYKIVNMTKNHWAKAKKIYVQGIETGVATFNIEAPSYEEWDEGHLKVGRLVALKDKEVLGWVALSPTSRMPAYCGSVEVSIYIADKHKGEGVGKALMEEVIKVSEEEGIWSFLSVIIIDNLASISFHERLGFRKIGTREKIAKLSNGSWCDTVLMEYRSKVVGID